MILCLYMNDDNQLNQDQNQQVIADNQQQVQSVPVGSINKEVGPVSDYVKLSESEPQIHPEAAKAGVETVSSEEKPQLTEEHFKIGVKESIPQPQIEPTGNVNLPMSQQQAMQTAKTDKKITDSILWMAIAVLRQLKKMHGKVFKQT